MFSFGMFSGVWSLVANVSERSICSIFIGDWVRSVTVVVESVVRDRVWTRLRTWSRTTDSNIGLRNRFLLPATTPPDRLFDSIPGPAQQIRTLASTTGLCYLLLPHPTDYSIPYLVPHHRFVHWPPKPVYATCYYPTRETIRFHTWSRTTDSNIGPKENTQHSKYCKSLKSRSCYVVCYCASGANKFLKVERFFPHTC
jgi:hypothetical protein